MWRFAILWVLSVACTQEQRFPGDEVMGTFRLRAVLVSHDCPFTLEANLRTLEPEITFSRVRENNAAYATSGGFSREGTFDGQVIRVRASAPRRFAHCECLVDGSLEEELVVALLSRAQSDALGGSCPESPLDGGVPTNVDAGVLPPGTTPTGFDALHACGELVNLVTPAAACHSCAGCTLTYRVEGVRR